MFTASQFWTDIPKCMYACCMLDVCLLLASRPFERTKNAPAHLGLKIKTIRNLLFFPKLSLEMPEWSWIPHICQICICQKLIKQALNMTCIHHVRRKPVLNHSTMQDLYLHLYYIYTVKKNLTQKTTAITTAVVFATCSYTLGQVVLF